MKAFLVLCTSLYIVKALNVPCNPPCLLVSVTTQIRAFDFRGHTSHTIISGLSKAVAIDIHYSLGYIFWSDVTELNIKRANIDGSNITVIHNNIGVCEGLAVEWNSSQLYWTDTTNGTLSVSDFQGNNKSILVSSNLDEPRGIVIDTNCGLMFWTDSGQTPKIERASLSGTQRVAIVTSNLQFPAGIDLDRRNRLVFWVDEESDKIEFADYNGNNRKLIFKPRQSSAHFFGITFLSSSLFVSEWSMKAVFQVINASSGNVGGISGVVFDGFVMGLVAYDSSRQALLVKTCTELPEPTNGRRFGCAVGCPGNISMYKDTVCQFSCNDGYIGSGSQVRRCQHNGTWSGQNFTCQIINCTSLTVDPSGPLRMSSCDNNYGAECNFSCTIGHRLNGSSTVTCIAPGNQHPGVWNNTIPTCEVITCPALLEPSNGTRFGCSGNAEMNYSTECRLSCNNGHIGSGSAVRTCQHNGTWSGNDFTCLIINCTSLTVDPSGPLLMSSCDNHYGDECNFSCTIGYRLNGSLAITCVAPGNQHPGVWNNTMPTCEVITCPALPEPSNGTRLGCSGNATMKYATECRFSCNNGYTGSGSAVRTCEHDGTWSGNDFTCQIINCTSLTVDPSGPLRMSSCDNHYGSKCNFSCGIGHHLNGSSTVTCVAPGNQHPGLWNNRIPTCEVITCPALPKPCNGTRFGCSGNAAMNYTTECQFSCNNGYTGSGSAERTCQHDGTWSGNDFTCEIINCTSLTVDPSGPLRMSSCDNHYGAECNFSCMIGHRLNGSSAITCVAHGNQHPGVWNNTIPTCEVITCPALPKPSNGTRFGCSGNEAMNYATECRFSCNNGYTGSGSAVRTCEHDGTWSGNDFTCLIINCTSLTVDPNGPLLMSSCDNHYGAKCSFSCTIGRRLNGSSTVTCVAPSNQHPGVWNNAIPTCEETSLKEIEESVLLEVRDLDIKKWNKQMEDDFKREVARVATDYCAADGTRCQFTLTSSRRKRSSKNLVFSKDRVYILPGYPKQLSDDPLIAQLAFYLRSPQGLSDSTVRKEDLKAIVESNVSSIERSINGTVLSVQPLFSATDTPEESEEESKPSTAIIIGTCVGVVLLVIIIVAVVLACKRHNRCLGFRCIAEKPKLSSGSLSFRADNNVGHSNPVFGGDVLTLHRRSSPEEETEGGQAEGQEHQETGQDSRDEKDPVYSEIPDILPHTYEELDSADIKFNVFYGGRKISDPSRFSNSHYQELDNANGKLNYLYARRSYPDHTYENADAQV
ncbi:uncharacterized protein LOC144628967 isoform X2 [Oculina patagonica]